MSLPRWWPRPNCVYCGTRINTDNRRPMRNHLLACYRHRPLLNLDPAYASAYAPGMHAADHREDEAAPEGTVSC